MALVLALLTGNTTNFRAAQSDERGAVKEDFFVLGILAVIRLYCKDWPIVGLRHDEAAAVSCMTVNLSHVLGTLESQIAEIVKHWVSS